VPDFYQGSELWDLSLVDPDNRRPVDYDARIGLLAGLTESAAPDTAAEWDLGRPKLWLIARVLQLRREHPDWFVGGGYTPVATSAGNAIAFGRGPAGGSTDGSATVITVATRLPVALARRGGWGEHTVTLPGGTWTDLLTGSSVAGGSARLSELLAELPVALLVAS
jgi:(1->4)-alpha-D-glucan 1-alpha-D-glucosylmutase